MKSFWRGAALLPLVLLLSSCMSLNESFVINDPSSVTSTIDIGVLESVATVGGSDATDICSSIKESWGFEHDLPAGIKFESGKEDGYLICSITLTGALPDDSMGLGVTIDHDNGVYRFAMGSGQFDWMEGAGAGSLADNPSDSAQLANLVSEFSIAVTFPGEVLSHNGSSQVRGTTVTWTDFNDLISGEGLLATGSDDPPFPWAALIGGVAALLVVGTGVGVVLWWRGKRRQAANALAQAQAQAQAPGQAQPYWSGAVPGAAPAAGFAGSQPESVWLGGGFSPTAPPAAGSVASFGSTAAPMGPSGVAPVASFDATGAPIMPSATASVGPIPGTSVQPVVDPLAGAAGEGAGAQVVQPIRMPFGRRRPIPRLISPNRRLVSQAPAVGAKAPCGRGYIASQPLLRFTRPKPTIQ
ncbi:MAG: hypothetical protein LBV30_07350 [Propionibacteriaceae bacterium]|jgi:hypothetical protein|nr:hypothetical protein [Propionibacteriaceae bacterium]